MFPARARWGTVSSSALKAFDLSWGKVDERRLQGDSSESSRTSWQHSVTERIHNMPVGAARRMTAALREALRGVHFRYRVAMALGLARIEAHYFVNDCFMPEGALLENADRIADIPGVIVQGRYDAVCPVISAVELSAAWPRANLRIVTEAGHSAMEPGIRSELIAAMEDFKAVRPE